ncbi:hypothetical protein [Escherichia coli]|uniref:hypothetical protein n=1 Tax=Escherichia coli TaxID=562 RepID=UPI0015912A36|nr:hypothetical protein [Escherichia coli]
MKQQKAMLIALIVICLTVRNPSPPLMCQASSMHPHLTRFGGFILSVNIFIKIMPTHSIKQKVSQIKKERNVQICCFPYLLTLT